MHILYDSQIFDAQIHGGISRYFYELIRRWPDSDITYTLGFSRTQNAYLLHDGSLNLGSVYANTKPDLISRGLRFLHRRIPQSRRDAFLRKHSLEETRYDLFHPTYYDPYFLERLSGRPFVLTVYDMIHETFPEHFAAHDPVPIWKKQLAHAASLILAISHNTKRDLIRFLNVPEEKIVVTHLGSSVDINENRRSRKNLLFIGKRGGYKNFDRMLRACAPIIKRYTEINLVCVGGGPFTNEEIRNISTLGLVNRVAQVRSSEEELAKFYDDALLFIFPSLYEGFGLPLLEAFARGCPVAAAGAGSLPEVAGDAAAFFDPNNEAQMTDLILSLVESDSRREILVQKGFKRTREFSWDKTAALTSEAYRSMHGA